MIIMISQVLFKISTVSCAALRIRALYVTVLLRSQSYMWERSVKAAVRYQAPLMVNVVKGVAISL